jgi:chemotaxis signal transduction protein
MSSRAEKQQLLERRAAKLAGDSREESTLPAPEVSTFITLVSAGQRYAIEARHAVRVLPNEKLCRLPAEAGELVGLVMAGGESVPVADLASLLGTAPPDRSRPFVVLIDGAGPPLGLLADEVESDRMSAAGIRVPFVDSDDAPSLERGVTTDGAVLLDTVRLLEDQRLSRFARPSRPAPDVARTSRHPGEL